MQIVFFVHSRELVELKKPVEDDSAEYLNHPPITTNSNQDNVIAVASGSILLGLAIVRFRERGNKGVH